MRAATAAICSWVASPFSMHTAEEESDGHM